jgi:sulfane dehydrogenase subunit SoxC
MAQSRAPIAGRFTAQEVALAARNSGMPLEALRYDVTPVGLHYLLIHFDIPAADASQWRLEISGEVDEPLSLSMQELRAMPSRTERVTLECAGNGRAQLSPRYPSVPWGEEGVSTAEWTGVALAAVLRSSRPRKTAHELVFRGADRGIDRGVEHDFARSLPVEEVSRQDVLLAYQMNGADLLPQHGAPLRLIVPQWYGMASVKWLQGIKVLDRAFDGLQQAASYRFRASTLDRGTPCRRMRVNSLMVPPGIPDFYTRARSARAGGHVITGRAWSGEAPVAAVQFAVDGHWMDAELDEPRSANAWRGWRAAWHAEPGVRELACRATDAAGNVQPLEPPWDLGGFGNNAIQRVTVTVLA